MMRATVNTYTYIKTYMLDLVAEKSCKGLVLNKCTYK